MPQNQEREVDSLEQLKKRLLYGRDASIKKSRSALRSVSTKAENAWEKSMPIRNKTKRIMDHPSMFKKFFFGALIFAFVAFVIAGFMLWKGGNTVSSKNIEIAVLGNSFTQGGEELALQVQIVNNNAVDLLFADLVIEYPKNTVAGADGEMTRIRKSLDTVPARSSVTELVNPILYGEQGSIKPIRIMLEYRLAGSSAIFVTEQSFPVTISEAPVALFFEGPQDVVSNQPVEFTVRVRQVASIIAPNMIVRVEYPNGFRLSSSDPSPVVDNNVWKIGDLAQGSEKSITIKGVVLGQDAEEKTFRIYVGEEDARDPSKVGTVYNSLLHTVVINRPFIEAHLSLNGSRGETIAINNGSTVSGSVDWANNLPTRVSNVEVRISLDGTYLDRDSITASGGFYNSSDNSIVWNRNTYNRFESVEPGDDGSFGFSFKTIPFASTLPVNPSITANIEITASEAGGVAGQMIVSGEAKTIRFNSDIELISEASYSTGPFKNTGPLPPKAESRTTYTVSWNVRNSINALGGGEVRAVLPVYVTWLGKTDPSNEQVTYDPTTREVVWKVGAVARGLGITNAGRETSFQIGLTPSLSQVNSIPQLVGEATFTATDSFTGTTLSTSRGSLSTRLLNEPGFRPGDEQVVR